MSRLSFINRHSMPLLCTAALLLALLPKPLVASPNVGSPKLVLSDQRGVEQAQGVFVQSHTTMSVTGLINKVTVKQAFKNQTDQVLNGRYVFPLPDESAVYQLKMRVGEREIIGKIEEKKRAQADYALAQRQGKKASLVTQKRANVFVSQIANIEPGQTVSIELVYQELVRYQQGQFSLRLPMVVAPRYQPSHLVYDMDLTGNWPKVKPSDPLTELEMHLKDVTQGVEPILTQQINIDLNLGFALNDIHAPFHAINQQNQGNRYQVALAEGTTLANRDFVLRFRPAEQEAVTAAVFKEHLNGEDYALIMLMPPSAQYQQQQRLAREVVFVIDTSGSMHGSSLEQAKSALFFALANLDPQDSFNILAFNSNVNAFSQHALPANDFNLRRARTFIYGLEAQGGTEIASALNSVLDGQTHHDFLRQVIFLTDGSVSNEAELFSQIKQQLGDSRLFTIGIGSAPNSYFMSRAAQVGRGTFTYIGDVSDVQWQMKNLFNQLANAALKQLHIEDAQGNALDFWPKPIPDLYFDQAMMVAVKLRPDQQEIRIAGSQANGPFSASFKLANATEGDNIARLWARQKIKALQLGAAVQIEHEEPIAEQVLSLALKYQLLSPYTALLAIEHSPSLGSGSSDETVITPMAVKGWTAPLPQTDGQSIWQLIAGLFCVLLAIAVHRYERKLC
ncbi:marine proteobacterial sortase target protein [Pseudoalteromonas ulvae]|uniref:Marine proteobacterial sortase target protein n=1 Tax=Pseudoalteromonas ulvae TaxID=107327 RepID=A0A244CRG4_PSEDV|nr:marine proteobacterial sortase target protein [Pseudoalteromonas ulvae]OUL57789.1 marine proteobacterial sortase target protein [Pseudoalteromonas ulvae]